MKNIRELYAENSTIDLLIKINAIGKLDTVFDNFKGGNIFNTWHFKLKGQEFEGCYLPTIGDSKRYYLTDYSLIRTTHRPGEKYTQIEDLSDEWISYLVSHLQGEDKEKYLIGLQTFINKMTLSFKQQILKVCMEQQYEDQHHNMIDLQPEKRLIEQQIEENGNNEQAEEFANASLKKYNKMEEMGKTTVIKPEITEEEIKQAVESARHHDTKFGL
ncbi:MAG: hypothetical protein J6Q15_02000 [Clostridia bacterium]|nr:hypothetical protein [Clostridia bacterium]